MRDSYDSRTRDLFNGEAIAKPLSRERRKARLQAACAFVGFRSSLVQGKRQSACVSPQPVAASRAPEVDSGGSSVDSRPDRIQFLDVHHGGDLRDDWPWWDDWRDSKAMDAASQFPSGSARGYTMSSGGAVFDTGFCGSRECAGRVFA